MGSIGNTTNYAGSFTIETDPDGTRVLFNRGFDVGAVGSNVTGILIPVKTGKAEYGIVGNKRRRPKMGRSYRGGYTVYMIKDNTVYTTARTTRTDKTSAISRLKKVKDEDWIPVGKIGR